MAVSLHLGPPSGIVPDGRRTRWTRHVGDDHGLPCGPPPFYGEARIAAGLLLEMKTWHLAEIPDDTLVYVPGFGETRMMT